ncbi:hypothetical protein H9P43_000092 [Blastocladiella emersonii ATCC 22665]|nr:hypothetical protein H9P43_000092 [Blastocladiella emersonii ATCC 22665]
MPNYHAAQRPVSPARDRDKGGDDHHPAHHREHEHEHEHEHHRVVDATVKSHLHVDLGAGDIDPNHPDGAAIWHRVAHRADHHHEQQQQQQQRRDLPRPAAPAAAHGASGGWRKKVSDLFRAPHEPPKVEMRRAAADLQHAAGDLKHAATHAAYAVQGSAAVARDSAADAAAAARDAAASAAHAARDTAASAAHAARDTAASAAHAVHDTAAGTVQTVERQLEAAAAVAQDTKAAVAGLAQSAASRAGDAVEGARESILHAAAGGAAVVEGAVQGVEERARRVVDGSREAVGAVVDKFARLEKGVEHALWRGTAGHGHGHGHGGPDTGDDQTTDWERYRPYPMDRDEYDRRHLHHDHSYDYDHDMALAHPAALARHIEKLLDRSRRVADKLVHLTELAARQRVDEARMYAAHNEEILAEALDQARALARIEDQRRRDTQNQRQLKEEKQQQHDGGYDYGSGSGGGPDRVASAVKVVKDKLVTRPAEAVNKWVREQQQNQQHAHSRKTGSGGKPAKGVKSAVPSWLDWTRSLHPALAWPLTTLGRAVLTSTSDPDAATHTPVPYTLAVAAIFLASRVGIELRHRYLRRHLGLPHGADVVAHITETVARRFTFPAESARAAPLPAKFTNLLVWTLVKSRFSWSRFAAPFAALFFAESFGIPELALAVTTTALISAMGLAYFGMNDVAHRFMAWARLHGTPVAAVDNDGARAGTIPVTVPGLAQLVNGPADTPPGIWVMLERDLPQLFTSSPSRAAAAGATWSVRSESGAGATTVGSDDDDFDEGAAGSRVPVHHASLDLNKNVHTLFRVERGLAIEMCDRASELLAQGATWGPLASIAWNVTGAGPAADAVATTAAQGGGHGAVPEVLPLIPV